MTPVGPEPGFQGEPHTGARPAASRGTALAHLLHGAIARSAEGEAIGQVADTILDLRTGRIAFALVTLVPVVPGGEITPGRHLAAVPWERVTLDADGTGLSIAAPAITVRGAPTIDLDGWPGPADAAWAAQVTRHYQDTTAAPREHSFAEELGLRSPVASPRGPLD